MADPDLDALWIDIDPHALERRERSNDWFFSASAEPDRMFGNFVARSVWANNHYPSQARELGFPVLHQPGDRLPTSSPRPSSSSLTGDATSKTRG